MPTHVNNDGTILVVSKRTNQYVDIMDKKLKKEFDHVYHIDHPSYMNPVRNDSFGVRIFSAFGSISSPIVGLDWSWADAGWLSVLRSDQSIKNMIYDSKNYTNNYLLDLQIKRINWYSDYDIIH